MIGQPGDHDQTCCLGCAGNPEPKTHLQELKKPWTDENF
jgi:hypothetical protein